MGQPAVTSLSVPVESAQLFLLLYLLHVGNSPEKAAACINRNDKCGPQKCATEHCTAGNMIVSTQKNGSVLIFRRRVKGCQ